MRLHIFTRYSPPEKIFNEYGELVEIKAPDFIFKVREGLFSVEF